MYNINRDSDYVTITMANSMEDSQHSVTGEGGPSIGKVVYKAKNTDFIIVDHKAKKVGQVRDEELMETLVLNGILH